mgnify:CR=1 FL=1
MFEQFLTAHEMDLDYLIDCMMDDYRANLGEPICGVSEEEFKQFLKQLDRLRSEL